MLDINVPSLEHDDTMQNDLHGVRYADVSSAATVDTVADILTNPSGLGTINHGHTKHFYSDGAFNLMQLISYVLKQTGPANLFLTTYSISDDSINTLRLKTKQGSLLSVRFIIDNRVRSMSPKNFDYLTGAFPGLYRCRALHAKVVLIWNDEWHITLIGSQNATKNPKLECGVIHTSEEVFKFHKNILDYEFDKGTT